LSNAAFYRLLKLGLTAIVFAVAAHFVQADKLLPAILTIRPSSLILAVLLVIPNLFLQYAKWLLLLRHLDRRIAPHEAWHSLLAGFPLGLATPGRWGELGRAIFLPAYPRLTIAALAALDKLMNFAVVMLCGGIGLAIFLHDGFLPHRPISPLLPVTVVLLVITTLLAAPAMRQRFVSWAARHHQSAAWLPLLKELDAKLLLRLFTLSVLFVVTFIVQLVILVTGVYPVQTMEGIAAAASTFFVQSALPIAIGDLGIRESAAAFFFGKLGVAPHAAFGAALVLFMINMLLPSALGLLVLWKKPSKPQSR
jgi:uncharacterized membrane protein YbhN (UPF0104 family)